MVGWLEPVRNTQDLTNNRKYQSVVTANTHINIWTSCQLQSLQSLLTYFTDAGISLLVTCAEELTKIKGFSLNFWQSNYQSLIKDPLDFVLLKSLDL